MTQRSVFIIHVLLMFYVATSLKAQHTTSATSERTVSKNGQETYRWKNSTSTTDFEIEVRGRIELTDDDKDVKSISDGGYLEISKTTFGSRRSVRIKGLEGKLQREYYDGRTKMPWEPNGKQWLAEILPEVVRTSTIGAESRVSRFFSKGGTNAVLSEIDRLGNDQVKTHYAKLLMKHPVPTDSYAMIIKRVTDGMESDHFITDFLQNNVNKFIQSSEATTAMFVAAREMDSDHYKAIVISEALKNKTISREGVQTALKTASEMDSDHYICEVLLNIVKQPNVNPATITDLISTTKSMESDHYRTVVLKQALSRKDLPDDAHRKLVESVRDMSSDHYITDVITDLMANKLSNVAMDDVLDLLSSVHSDHYRTEIFIKLLDSQQLTKDQLQMLLNASAEMDSDHFKSVVLKDALTRASTPEKIVTILNSLGQINSDHYVTEVLLSAAPKIKEGNNDLKDAYRQAARRISSEHYYGRALKAIEL